MLISDIRCDLKDIRYYYSRKASFDMYKDIVGENKIVHTIKKYNEIMQSASPKLYDLYINLYVRNNTQESLSDELNYTPEYIQMLNKKLLLFLKSEFDKNE